jgi:hypothetical protein
MMALTRLREYIERARPEFKARCLKYIKEYERPIRAHRGSQRGPNGLAIHTVQVIEKALELNAGFDEQHVIEAALVHDLEHWEEFPLRPYQTTAVLATRGLPWQVWRKHSRHYRFVVLILIADMWSAYLNGE